MDLANMSRSLSSMLNQEIFRDCSMACFNEQSYNPDMECVKNCSSKHAQLLSAFEKVTKAEMPKLHEPSRIQ
jgi:hypothetical protein